MLNPWINLNVAGSWNIYFVTNSALLERLRNENEDKTKTQMMQSFNQYSERETKI